MSDAAEKDEAPVQSANDESENEGETVAPREDRSSSALNRVNRVEPPAELARLVSSVVRSQVQKQLSIYNGPLPPPDMLKEYEHVLPGLAERIVKSFEEEGPHRRSLQHREMLLQEREMTQIENLTGAKIVVMMRAQWLAFAVFVIWTAIIGALIAVGLVWPSTLLGAVNIISVIVFVLVSRREKKADRGKDALSGQSKPTKQLNDGT